MDRNHFSRRSDPPGMKNKKERDKTGVLSQTDNEMLMSAAGDSMSNIKRRGASLARMEYNRENSYSNSGFSGTGPVGGSGATLAGNKRTSVLDMSHRPSATDSGSSSGGTKILNTLRSALSLSKTKSKSKLNLEESGIMKSCQSEENVGLASLSIVQNGTLSQPPQSRHSASGPDPTSLLSKLIQCRNLSVSKGDPTLYIEFYNDRKEFVQKSLVVLDETCVVEPVHPSLVDGIQFCFQIIKPNVCSEDPRKFCSLATSTYNYPSHQYQQITPVSPPPPILSPLSKSYSFNSSFAQERIFTSQQQQPSPIGPSSASSSSDAVYVFQCDNNRIRSDWISRIKKIIMPNVDECIRNEDYLKIWIQEAKNLIPKKKYYCELKLDGNVYGHTTEKLMNDSVFWGEEFELNGLHRISSISILIFRRPDSKKKREKSTEFVAQIQVPVSEMEGVTSLENWFPSTASASTATVRVKARHRSLLIKPVQQYDSLVSGLLRSSERLVSLCRVLQPFLSARAKLELVTALLHVLLLGGNFSAPMVIRAAPEMPHIYDGFLAGLVALEVTEGTSADGGMLLRGNSMASKAMEAFMRLVGGQYLVRILKDLVQTVKSKHGDCEVDPTRIPNNKDDSVLINNQKRLTQLVEDVWKRIVEESDYLPSELRRVFDSIRTKINSNLQLDNVSDDFVDKVVSSCLFLRYICPAIMSPFMFGLTPEYSDKPGIHRTFTLVAKVIQSLANFTEFQDAKEGYMGFMQPFLTRNYGVMTKLLRRHSTYDDFSPPSVSECRHQHDIASGCQCSGPVDAAYLLADLTLQLAEHLHAVPQEQFTAQLVAVHQIVEHIGGPYAASSWSTPSSRIPVLRTNQPLSLPQSVPRTDEENFSYIPPIDDDDDDSIFCQPQSSRPQQQHQQQQYKQQQHKHKLGGDSYVDFEELSSLSAERIYDDVGGVSPSKTSYYQQRQRQAPVACRLLNEPEINRDWSQLVSESTQVQSVPPLMSSSRYNIRRPANIIRRIQQQQQQNQYRSSSDQPAPQQLMPPPPHSLYDSSRSLDSAGRPLNSGFSPTCYFQPLSTGISSPSVTAIATSNGSLHRHNSLAQCITCNVDLDPLISNEMKRLRRLLELYEVEPRPSSGSINAGGSLATSSSEGLLYCGSAVEQYKQRCNDENMLSAMYAAAVAPDASVTSSAVFSRDDIVRYLPVGYRLLKNVQTQGTVAIDVAVHHVMVVNRAVHAQTLAECCQVDPASWSSSLPSPHQHQNQHQNQHHQHQQQNILLSSLIVHDDNTEQY